MFETDVDLLRKVSQDDQTAFKTLYQRHWKPCYMQVFRRSGDAQLAEDLTQAVFVSLWENRKSSTITNLTGYLFRALQFKFITHLKSQVHASAYMTHAIHHQPGFTESTEFRLRTKELQAAIDRGVAMMSAKTREVYTLSRNDHHSVKEIARKLDLSEKAVEYHITQSLKTMRLALRDFLPLSSLLLFF